MYDIDLYWTMRHHHMKCIKRAKQATPQLPQLKAKSCAHLPKASQAFWPESEHKEQTGNKLFTNPSQDTSAIYNLWSPLSGRCLSFGHRLTHRLTQVERQAMWCRLVFVWDVWPFVGPLLPPCSHHAPTSISTAFWACRAILFCLASWRHRSQIPAAHKASQGVTQGCRPQRDLRQT